MNLSNYATALSKFNSTLESPVTTINILSKPIESSATVSFNTVKDLLNYYLQLYIKEALVDTQITLLDLDDRTGFDEATSFKGFIDSTYRLDKPSFKFQTTDVSERVPLSFRDYALLGDENIYKAFDTVEEATFRTQMSASLDEIKQHSQKYYKHKSFRGIIAFERPLLHTKGYTIYLIDKKLYATIIASSYSLSTGYGTYIAILYTGV